MTQPGFMKQPAPIVIKKTMNISNPIGNNMATHNIFEDILPTTKRKFYFSNLEERIVTYEFFRNILIKEVEGDEISLGYDKTGILNLSSIIKVLEINPFYNRLLHANKYASLPHKMLFFSSCYPIQVNRERHRIDCAKHAMGVNIRLYDLDIDELKYFGINNNNNKFNYNVWRDIAYYKHIRNKVLLRKKSPNFLMMYSYHIADDYYVDFSGLDSVMRNYKNKVYPKLWKKHKKNILNNYKKLLENKKSLNKLENGNYFNFMEVQDHGIKIEFSRIDNENISINDISQIQQILKDERAERVARKTILDEGIVPHDRVPLSPKIIKDGDIKATRIDVINEEISLESNRMLVVLTESPTYTIMDWCTRLYHIDDRMYMRVNTLGETGYHREEVWYTVLFQILVITKVLFDYNIVCSDLQASNNTSLFIKDLHYNDNFAKGIYKYKVGGINYFVPNYGTLVIFDPFPINTTIKPTIGTAVAATAATATAATAATAATTASEGIVQHGGFMNQIPYIPPGAKPLYPIPQNWHYFPHKKLNQKIDPKILKDDDDELEDYKSMYSNNIFNDNEDTFGDKNIGEKFIENMKHLLCLDWMDNGNFKSLGGVDAPENIKSFIAQIKQHISTNENNIKGDLSLKDALPKELHPEYIISKFFRRFIHNSIGKEVQYADKNLKPPVRYDFKKGDIIAYLDNDSKYKWGIVKDDVNEGFQYENGIVTIESKIKIIKNNKYNDDNDDEINKYYCKIPVDYDKTPLNFINSKEGESKIIDEYNVDLL